ncbi:MAG: hypothetical protein CM1200mP16_11290 [Nitrospina sp.]|nr:MAG: hypothetical protein CM1200mP16_11290 [Nitrospina sp.]
MLLVKTSLFRGGMYYRMKLGGIKHNKEEKKN